MSFTRDLKDLKKTRTTWKGTRGWEKRPVWEGPVPDRYYYMVKNKRRDKNGPYIGLYTDDSRFEGKVRTILVNRLGNVSLMESDVPLPTGPDCKLKSHSKIEKALEVLRRSLDKQIDDPNTGFVYIEGKPWTEEDELEVFE